MTVEIRDATFADCPVIVVFNAQIALETEARELDRSVLLDGVSELLGDNGKGRYWIAELDGKIVGQIMVTFEWSDWRNGLFWWIQSVYVDSDFRRLGVFRSLYQHVRTLARSDPRVCGLRLYVEKENTKAQQTYASLGMIDTGYRLMQDTFRPE